MRKKLFSFPTDRSKRQEGVVYFSLEVISFLERKGWALYKTLNENGRSEIDKESILRGPVQTIEYSHHQEHMYVLRPQLRKEFQRDAVVVNSALLIAEKAGLDPKFIINEFDWHPERFSIYRLAFEDGIGHIYGKSINGKEDRVLLKYGEFVDGFREGFVGDLKENENHRKLVDLCNLPIFPKSFHYN